jgi:putative spermidine/putrescine transport system permease protein
MKRHGRLDERTLLIVPAMLLLALTFVAPLLWFFIRALSENRSPAELLGLVYTVATSRAVLTALLVTFWISLLVTVAVLLVSYPVAYYLASRSGTRFTLVLFCIIVPYFTSIVVRTYSWMVILGRTGLISQALQALGLVEEPPSLLFSKTAIVIGMVYVLLPYMALMRAARGLGAGGIYAFRRIYLPLSMHGVVSGSLIVFILAIGFFITPALMGGPEDVMIAMLIERSVEILFDWSSAAVMSLLLLAATLVLYTVYYRLTDVRRMMGA